ncbi:MAG: pyridoxal phosphate-dependent aminotransferase [Myxococcales bacterium]|nr:pyridoxal phosphate-dependent aminotransferase [Myxococcales bacterium]
MPRFPNIAEHAHSVSARVYSRLAQRARAKNAEVYPLHVGDTYRDPVPAAQAERQLSREHPGLHKYAPVQGEPSAIDAFLDYVRARHGQALDRELVQVMSGATAGLSIVCQVLLEPGDEVLLPSPFWPLSRGIIATKGAVPVQVPFYTRLDEPGFDPEAALEGAVTERTVALYVNTPNNPSGRVLSEQTIAAMMRVAKRHGLWLFCDEAYEEIYFDRQPPDAIWKRPDVRDRAIAFHTLSKTFGFAGARIGFTHGPKSVMGAVRGMQTFHTYCAARPMQFGAVGALREGRAWVEESRTLYRDAGYMAADALGVSRPEGGTFLFLDVNGLLEPGAEDCSAFLERCADQGVLLTPGRSCGDDYARWVRLCFTSVRPARLEAALEKLAPLFRGPS